VQLAVEARAGVARVGERDLAALVDRARRGDAQERALELRPARQSSAHGLISLRGEQKRQRGRPFPQVGAGDLPGLDRHA
jgi:hypothetical protein